MLEEALPVAAGVAIALLPALAFGGLSAARSFILLAGEESGFYKALEESKSEEEALNAAGIVAASPLESISASKGSPTIHSPIERRPKGMFYGFAAKYLH
eukprot:jgi/Chrzof1/8075/UNPLg00120.t1